MRGLVAAFLGCVFLCSVSGVGLAQTEVLVDEDFETGVLDPTVWNAWRNSGSNSLTISNEGGEHGYTATLVSTGPAMRMFGAYVLLPAFEPDDILLTQFNVRLNAAPTWFTSGYGKLLPGQGEGGEETPISSTVWHLPVGFGYASGIGSDPHPEGHYVSVAKSTNIGEPLDYYETGEKLTQGQWSAIRLLASTTEVETILDGTTILELDAAQMYYTFEQEDDWIFKISDGGTHNYELTNASFDNVLCVLTKESVLALYDEFGLPFSAGDDLYLSFVGDVLLQALTESQGDWDLFMRLLFPPEQKVLEPELECYVIENDDGSKSIVVENLGPGDYLGPIQYSAALSYDASWLGESVTEFFRFALELVFLHPCDTIEARFRRASESGSGFGVLEFPSIVDDETGLPFTLTLENPSEEHFDVFRDQIYTWWSAYEDKEPGVDYVDLRITGAEMAFLHSHVFIPITPIFEPPR